MLKQTKQWLGCIFVLLFLLSGCSAAETAVSPYPDIPDEIYGFFIDLLEDAKDGFSGVIDRDYYPEEYEYRRELARQGGEYVIDYQIVEAEKINDNLYGFIYLQKSNATLGKYIYMGSFVTRMDGQLYRIPNVFFVPESLANGSDLTKYTPEAMNANIDPADPDIISYITADEDNILG